MMQIRYCSAKELDALVLEPLKTQDTLVVIPFTNTSMVKQSAELMAKRAMAPGSILAVFDDLQLGFIRIVNQVFRQTQSDTFAYAAQDAFAGRAWLKLALDALGQQYQFLGFNDGKWAGAIASFGLARRPWASQNYQGNFFCPQYRSHYADAELGLLAMQEGVYVYEANSLLVEMDWEKDTKQVDENDRKIFLQRRAIGFDAKVTNPHLLQLIT
jgi:hypothetical protein